MEFINFVTKLGEFISKCVNDTDKKIDIDFNILNEFDPLLAKKLINDPEVFLDEIKRECLSTYELKFSNLPDTLKLNIEEIRTTNHNKLWIINGIVVSKSIVEPLLNKVVFECNGCSQKIEVEQKTDNITKPSICKCGSRTFCIFDKKHIDYGEIDITSELGISQIKIKLTENNTKPKLWENIKIGEKINVVGKLDLEFRKNKSFFFVTGYSLTINGDLSLDRKAEIVLNYLNQNISSKMDYRFSQDMLKKGVDPLLLPEILEKLHSQNLIKYDKRRNEIFITKIDNLDEKIL